MKGCHESSLNTERVRSMAAVHRCVSDVSSAGKRLRPVHCARRLRHHRGVHLLATISAHGFGHLAQTAPVLQALQRQCPRMRLTIASTLPEARLHQRIEGEFRIEARALDIGFLMRDAFHVDLPASAAAYRELHADWDAQLVQTSQWLAGLQPDLLLCNAAYLPLAAAARLGLPAFGMSSLNWADLFVHLYGGAPWAPAIHAQMLQAYQVATAFIKLTPGMDMPELPRGVRAGPVASLGRARRDELRARLQAEAGERIVLIAFGGIDARLPLEQWRLDAGLRWLVPAAWGVRHARVSAIETLDWPFGDLLASVDALIGKPGYGSFVEAACLGLPMLYAARPSWPEQEPLVRWLHAHGRALQVEDAALRSGDLAEPLTVLWRQPTKPPVQPTGADEVARLLTPCCS
jgi:hypothetical protein